MSKYEILIADGLAKEGLARLRELPEVELWERSDITKDQLHEIINQIDVLIVRSRTKVDRELFKRATRLKLVLRAGIGLDNVDVEAATDHGVIVMNAPTGNIVTTAEHTIALLFAVSRLVPQADGSLRQGRWEKKKFQGHEIRGKTLGIVGVGNIGTTVAHIAVGLGMRVVGHDPYISEERAAQHHIRLLPLDSLLKEADYVTLHLPLTASTRHMFGREMFKKMKKGAYLINCARGGIVDESALIEALDNKVLGGCALDVFEQEPLPATHPLLKRDDVVLTPHLGASTDEAQIQVGLEVAEQIAQFVKDGALKNAINVPNISLEQMNILKPYVTLCERLGALAAQISPPGNVKKVGIRYEGSFPIANHSAMTLAALKGFLTPLTSTSVNFVNARNLLKARGIQVEESVQDGCDDHANLVSIQLEGEKSLVCRGTLFGKKEPRVVGVAEFEIDAILEGTLLITKNVDQPGVIGSLGSYLSGRNINIAGMHLGRNRERGEAMAIIAIDSEVSDEDLKALRQVPGMISVTQTRL